VFNYGMHHFNLLGILFFLLVGHFLADYPLQNDYLASAKNPTLPQGQGGVWKWALTGHSMIHAGFVAIFTHSILLGVFEAITHAIIDYLKCRKLLSYHQDQWLHVSLKVVWAACAATGFA
jgi:hypothetical protein